MGGVERGSRDSQHGTVANKGSGQRSRRLGCRTGTPNQLQGKCIPWQGVSFLICKT